MYVDTKFNIVITVASGRTVANVTETTAYAIPSLCVKLSNECQRRSLKDCDIKLR